MRSLIIYNEEKQKAHLSSSDSSTCSPVPLILPLMLRHLCENWFSQLVPSFEPIHWALHFTDFSSFFKFIIFLKTESSEVFFSPHNVLLLSHGYIPDVSAALGRAHVISDLWKHIIHLCTREHFPIKDIALKESSKLVSLRKKMKEAKISLAIWQYLENLC